LAEQRGLADSRLAHHNTRRATPQTADTMGVEETTRESPANKDLSIDCLKRALTGWTGTLRRMPPDYADTAMVTTAIPAVCPCHQEPLTEESGQTECCQGDCCGRLVIENQRYRPCDHAELRHGAGSIYNYGPDAPCQLRIMNVLYCFNQGQDPEQARSYAAGKQYHHDQPSNPRHDS
jgi:hypothetical protein